MMRPTPIALLLTLSVVLVACGSAPTRLYTLHAIGAAGSAEADKSAAPYAGPAVRVDAVHVPPAFDRIEIVESIAPGEMQLHDMDHWSAPLGDAARQILSADLSTRLPPGRLIYPHLPKPDGTLGISVDILEFSSGAGGAHLQASWSVTSPDIRPGERGGNASLQISTLRNSAAGAAEAWSSLLGELADRIVAQLRTDATANLNY